MSDVYMSVHRLLHNGVFVVFTAALVAAGTEITHHEVRNGVSKYIFQNGTRRNCMPILPPEYCAEGTIPAKRNPVSGCNWPCRCESERMVMNELCSCQDVKVQCGKNTYLKDGVCLPCPAGTYKPGHGTGPCISKMSPSTQPPMHHPTTSPASQINTTLGAKGNLTRKVTGTNMTDGGIEAEEKPPKNGSSINQNILAICISTLVIIVLALLAAVIYMYKLRKRKLSCQNTAQPSDSNESLMQDQAPGNGGDAHNDDNPPPYSSLDATSPIRVTMEDEEGQGMARPFTGDFSTDQASGGNKASSVSPPEPEGVATTPAVVSSHRQDSHETVRKEYETSPLPPETPDVSFPTLESAEQADPVASEHSKDADHTSVKKRYSSNMEEVSSENEKAENVESLPLLESAPSLKLDSFKS
ncbi:uncharacterized protein LOC124144925 isoform X2 [Haliotis rufescens]|uniref:uncharacterized protein LOC124144925 isoform X2 n=1 Tax=Haliotis rufescens TaxID=6454 RepID=UPI00201F1D78|nr:uncharacterized protein LOC124144925 isoform X2 [Haliotis rufescens]